jgi:AcrR family transcriptional regulator
VDAKARRAARHGASDQKQATTVRRRKESLTVERVVDAALNLVALDGYDALTMRRLATELGTGPASLYVHVVNKADLDELLIGRLCARLTLPDPDPARWRQQLRATCGQLRDQYLSYPGISRASYAIAPTDPEILRVSEGMLGVLWAGGASLQVAAWTVDALLLYVAAYCQERAAVDQCRDDDAEWVVAGDELRRRLAALPVEHFPHTVRLAGELTGGADHERFDFTIGLMIDGAIAARGR